MNVNNEYIDDEERNSVDTRDDFYKDIDENYQGNQQYGKPSPKVQSAVPTQNPIYLLALHRLLRNRDLKILVTGAGGTTGVGKSLFALTIGTELNNFLNQNYRPHDPREFNDENLFVDAWEYIDYYPQVKSGEVLLHDEIEVAFDNRRSMTERSVEGTQRYYTMRAFNAITIATAPSYHNLDIRIAQNFDLWVLVQGQGEAIVFYMRENDMEGYTEKRLMKYNGSPIRFKWALPSVNSKVMRLKEKLDEMKDDIHDGNTNQNKRDEDERDPKVTEMEQEKVAIRRELVKELYPDFTQKDIAHRIGVSQSTVADDIDSIKRNEGADAFN